MSNATILALTLGPAFLAGLAALVSHALCLFFLKRVHPALWGEYHQSTRGWQRHRAEFLLNKDNRITDVRVRYWRYARGWSLRLLALFLGLAALALATPSLLYGDR